MIRTSFVRGVALTAAAVPLRAVAQAALQPVSVVVGGVTEIGYI